MNSRQTDDRQVPALTGFRGLAALMVFVAHYIPQGKAAPGLWIAGYGARGVDFFFVLSGYLFTWLYFERFANGTWDLRSYFHRRLARILPSFWVVAALSWCVSPGLRDTVPLFSAGLLANLALLQKYLPTLAPLVPQGWTLTVEELFYATFPFIIWGMSRLGALGPFRERRWMAFNCFLASVWLVELFLWMKFLPFALGIVLARACREKDVARAIATRRVALMFGIVAALSFAVMPLCWGNAAPPAHQTSGWSAFGLTFFSAIAGASFLASLLGAAPWRGCFETRAAVFAGKISYCFYLVHMLVLGLLKDRIISGVAALSGAESGAKTVVCVAAVVTLGCSVMAAWLLHVMVEEPCRRLILRFTSPSPRRLSSPGQKVVSSSSVATVGAEDMMCR